MTKIVVSEFTDAFTGVRYQPGQRVPRSLGDAQVAQAEAKGCVRDIDLDALTDAERGALAATGVNLALAEMTEEALADAGRVAHGAAPLDIEAEIASRRAKAEAELERYVTDERARLGTSLAADDEASRATLRERLEADEATARADMKTRLAAEEDGLRAEMTARLAEAGRADEQATTGSAGGAAPAPGGATTDQTRTGKKSG